MDRRLQGLARIIRAAVERYEAKSEVKGNLRLPDLTEEERLALAGLIGDHVKARPGETLVFPLAKLDELLRERGIGAGLVDVAVTLEGRPILTRAERQAAVAERWERLLAGGWPQRPGRAATWRERLRRGESTAVTLLQREFNRAEQAGDTGHRELSWSLGAVTQALDQLPADGGASLRLPVFASRLTGDPHGFDDALFAGRLLVRALTDLIGPGCGIGLPPADSVERGILLTAAGLLPDGISSYVACFGLGRALRATGHDLQVEAAQQEGSVLLASLRQVAEWSGLELSGTILYAVENPPVYEELVDSLRQAGLSRPLVCTSGFLSVAACRVLDLAVAGGATIAYGGDFDPNGLTIAAKLIQRYGDHLQLWGMSVADYLAAAAHPRAERFTEGDLRKLAAHDATRLEPLSRAMRDQKKAAFQEALLDRLRVHLIGE